MASSGPAADRPQSTPPDHLQVDHAFAEDHLEREASERAKRAKGAAPVQALGGELARRQMSWLTRDEASSQTAAWRPLKFYRTSARKFLVRLDNQVRASTCRPGIWGDSWRVGLGPGVGLESAKACPVGASARVFPVSPCCASAVRDSSPR